MKNRRLKSPIVQRVMRHVLSALSIAVFVTACGPSASVPEIRSFEASPSVVVPGGEVELSWDVVGASELTIGPGGVDVSGSSTAVVTPELTTSYVLTARNVFGVSTSATVRVVVDDVSITPTIDEFRSVIGVVNPGVATALAFSVRNATELTLFGPGLGVGGRDVTGLSSFEVVPSVGGRYELVAVNGDPSVSVSREIQVGRDVAAATFLIGGQSNAVGYNVESSKAGGYIAADPGVRMFGNDYVWKDAYEPTDDCTDQKDAESAPDGTLVCIDMGGAGVSFGVSLGNRVAAASGGGVFLIPAARGGSRIDQWLPATDRYDRTTLFGSAATRAVRAETDRGAPIGYKAEDGGRYGAVLWFQGESETSSLSRANGHAGLTDRVFDAFRSELGAPVVFAQLARRYESDRNLLYQVVRESQRGMAAGARNADGTFALGQESDRFLVVTHDLPLVPEGSPREDKHLTAGAQIELGRRISLAVREHLLGELGVDGTGPRLVRIDHVPGSSVVGVVTDRDIRPPDSAGPSAYSGYFAVFQDGVELAVASIERGGDGSSVRITLGSPTSGPVEVRYMPPAGGLDQVEVDVIRSEACLERMPVYDVCLPMPAFGAESGSAVDLRLLRFEDDDVR